MGSIAESVETDGAFLGEFGKIKMKINRGSDINFIRRQSCCALISRRRFRARQELLHPTEMIWRFCEGLLLLEVEKQQWVQFRGLFK